MKLLAHISEIDGQRREQNLKNHCENVAEYAKARLSNTGFADIAYLAGLLHDMGKATEV